MTSIYDSNGASDLDVDWIYRGKKKSKRSSTNNGNKDKTPINGSHLNNNSITTPTISNTSNKVTPTISPVDQQQQQQQNEQQATQQHHRSLLSQQLKNRPRSASDSSKKPPSVKKPILNVSTSLKRSNSLNESNNNNQSVSNQSPQQKPKKSIFSAFSKLKSSKQSTSEPVSIPTPKSSAPATPKSLPSSVDSVSSTLLLGPSHLQHQTIHKDELNQQQPQERIILNKNPNRSALPIKTLANVRLRRVTFALDKLPDDPPQQIPSRRPKKGNVIVVDDLVSGPAKLSIGITNENQVETKKYDEKEFKLVLESQRRALEEAEKHAQEAHFAAKRIAHEVKNFKHSKKSEIEHEQEQEEQVELDVSNLEIDKPIHLHEHHYEEEEHKKDEDIPLELIYTRCCHLREILPIPATLKQLKNKHSPLTTLKMLNPKPTLIDIYSFSDFIAIVPIKTLIFDNVTMNSEMLKIILSSCINSTTLLKLTFKNVPIDSNGWKYLCKFLSRNKSVQKLDISQMKLKTDLPLSQHRSEMDWELFINTLNLRGGIQELILNGCKLNTLDFLRLIDEGVSLSTKRLGLASMDLNSDQIRKVANWMTFNGSCCEGVDLGYNDLSIESNFKPLIKKISYNENPLLASISLNSTNLTNVEDVALLIRSLSKVENLNFLDLSNLKEVFPSIMPYLNKYLPRFPNLKRLHLDSNELSTKSFSILSGIIPKCNKLIHISIMNQSAISYESAATLYSAVKSSPTILNLDLDYDLIDEKISSRIAVCLMKNMERTMHGEENTQYHHLDSHDDILFDGSLIAETAGKLIEKFNTNEIENDEFSKKFLKKKFLNKIIDARSNINKTIDELLTKQDQKLLSLQEKEDLLRFYFLDNSLLKIFEIFENLNDDSIPQQSNDTTTLHPHQMATELTEGKETPIDVATGKPILLRSVSQTSMQAKKQEEEEGEFHRWGFFVQQQRQLYPNDKIDQPPILSKIQPQSPPRTQQINSSPQQRQSITPSSPPDLSKWAKLPSGEELRDAVIKAKGINSISDLIDNVNEHRFNLNNIYPTIKEHRETTTTNDISSGSDVESDDVSNVDGGVGGYEGADGADDGEKIDEVYDKLLNNLQKVRSNK